MSVFDKQVGGSHYKQLKIQPVHIYDRIPLPTMGAIAIKYIVRWRHKNGLEDLKKAFHCLDMLRAQDYEKAILWRQFLDQFPKEEQRILQAILDRRYTDAMQGIMELGDRTKAEQERAE
jgi:hypothetical protein